MSESFKPRPATEAERLIAILAIMGVLAYGAYSVGIVGGPVAQRTAVTAPQTPEPTAPPFKTEAEALPSPLADMGSFTGGGAGQLAVSEMHLKRSVGDMNATGNGRFAEIYISVRNSGRDVVNVNPNDFTLADTGGSAAPYSTQTFTLSTHLEVTTLSPGESASGWLVFFVSKDKSYVLTRHSMDSPITKKTVSP